MDFNVRKYVFYNVPNYTVWEEYIYITDYSNFYSKECIDVSKRCFGHTNTSVCNRNAMIRRYCRKSCGLCGNEKLIES